MMSILYTIISLLVGGLIGFSIARKKYKTFLMKKLRSRRSPMRRCFYKNRYKGYDVTAHLIEEDRLNDMTKVKLIDVQLINSYKQDFINEFNHQWILTNQIDFGSSQDILKQKLDELLY